jgi:hypothetical protein
MYIVQVHALGLRASCGIHLQCNVDLLYHFTCVNVFDFYWQYQLIPVPLLVHKVYVCSVALSVGGGGRGRDDR